MRTGRDRVTVNGHEPAFGAEVFRTLVFSTRPVSLQIGLQLMGNSTTPRENAEGFTNPISTPREVVFR